MDKGQTGQLNLNHIVNENIIKSFRNEKGLLIIIFIVFLVFLISNIQFPGLESDEACDGIWASYIIRPGGPTEERIDNVMSITLFNRSFPIMANNPYIGAVESYLLVPFFLLFGINVFALRLMPITISLITVFFIYLLCKAWFGQKMAFVTIILTVTNPVFVMYSRVGLYREELFLIYFFWGGLLFLWKYSKEQNIFYLCLGFFLFGLGLGEKIMFLWYIMGMIIACVIFSKKVFSLIKINLLKFIFGFLAFCFGSFFLLFFNIKTKGETIRVMMRFLSHPTEYGVNNLLYLNNLTGRGVQFFEILKGYIEEGREWVGPNFVLLKDYLSFILFVSGLVFVFFLLFFKKGKYCPFAREKVLLFYIIYLVIFLCSPFTLSYLCKGHLFILFPFPQIVVALFLCNLSYLFHKKKDILIFIYSIFIFLIFLNTGMIMRYHSAMRKNGGVVLWSTAVYELADYLYKNKIFKPFTLEWGFQHNVPFLTNNKVRPKDIYRHSFDELKIKFRECLLKEDLFYLVTSTNIDVADTDAQLRFKLIKQNIRELNKVLILNKKFFNRGGMAVYYLYEVH